MAFPHHFVRRNDIFTALGINDVEMPKLEISYAKMTTYLKLKMLRYLLVYIISIKLYCAFR